MACPAYGMPVLDDTIDSFTYTPASPIHSGDTLTFTADVPEPGIELVRVRVYGAAVHWADLNDAGEGPDAQAGDGVWTGELNWKQSMGTGENMSVVASTYHDATQSPTGERMGEPLTVLP